LVIVTLIKLFVGMLKFSKIIFSKNFFLFKNIKIYWNYFFQCGIFNFNLLFNKHVLMLCLYYSNVNPKESSSFKWWSSATIMLDINCPFACNYACNELLQSYCLIIINFSFNSHWNITTRTYEITTCFEWFNNLFILIHGLSIYVWTKLTI